MADSEFNAEMARALLASHAADWADLPIRPVQSSGTDNALFMLGADLVLRIPKYPDAASFLTKELTWLPKLSGLPLAVPELVFRAKASHQFEFEFGILRWIQGQLASPDQISDADQAALALADFLSALHQVETGGAPRAGEINSNRGIPLAEHTDTVSSSIAILADEIDTAEAHAIWDRACAAGPAQSLVWVHGDLKSSNLIANGGKLSAVIDWGLSAVGDPAVDYAAAWSWVEPESRDRFRQACRIDEDDWHRAKGWALYAAVIALSYYRGRSHEALCKQSRLTLHRLELLR